MVFLHKQFLSELLVHTFSELARLGMLCSAKFLDYLDGFHDLVSSWKFMSLIKKRVLALGWSLSIHILIIDLIDKLSFITFDLRAELLLRLPRLLRRHILTIVYVLVVIVVLGIQISLNRLRSVITQ